MSKQIHDESRRESSRRPQVRFRADEDLLDAFDEWVDGSEYDSRSAALRGGMRRLMGAASIQETPLDPPSDEPARTVYLQLVELANHDQIVRHKLAVTKLATLVGEDQTLVNRWLHHLSDRGYLKHKTNVYNQRAWKLNDPDDQEERER